ncbi:SAM-dependent methyltransferase [Ramlibacter rhizophilus]|uniref:Class I SAM-dependent methyltransferase n=1 Tax=Ramlibacter rhizophilus TaxID=1781167 RepID=A0A4Z0C0K9_9BURK|nr:class I SAM-dependent methyltransferase [Ramlibacter rhizophilus]TFZ04741.1 class I SAM-dependent methyltransferase [Ramlibacter rhizophilus]
MHGREFDEKRDGPQWGRRPLLLAGLGLLTVPRLSWSQGASTAPALDVPYVPTPQPVVDRMLEMAKVNSRDVLYDLGCGDGRIVITASKQHGARGVGIDLNPVRIEEAKANAKQAGVSGKVDFRVGDLFEADFSPATVVTLYLLPNINRKLRPQLWRQLDVGTRVVSHAFDMGEEWPPERVDKIDHRTLYLWTIRPEHKRA